MDQVSKALTPNEIARMSAAPAAAAVVRQIVPAGFETERSVQLAVPISVDGLAITSISVRRLKGRDLRAIQTMAGDEDAGLLSVITGLAPEVIEELDLGDYVRLLEVAQDFLPQQLQAAAVSTAASGPDSRA